MTRHPIVALTLAAWLAIAVIFAIGFLAGRASASRSAQQTEPLRPEWHDVGALSPLPTPDLAAPSEVPWMVTPAPSVQRSPSPTRMQPAATAKPRAATPTRHHVSGTASWFASPQNVSAAGPALRRAIGPNWRGTVVTVTANGFSVRTQLGDWMRADRLIDLDRNIFAALAPLSQGIVKVEVSR